MSRQITDCVFMVRPLHFCMNEQTAITNHFQQQDHSLDTAQRLTQVQREFDRYVEKLIENDVKVIVIEDRPDIVTPDSIFPNNWVVTDDQGDLSLFPMCAPNRRLERRMDVLDRFRDNSYQVNNIIDLSQSEEGENGRYLEGTGSMILDRHNRLAYCALSPRSDLALLHQFCEKFQYKPVAFKAFQTVASSGERAAIYHTNVMLTIAETFAVICLNCIDDHEEREMVRNSLLSSGKEIIEITEDQVASFAGNMLQLCNSKGDRFLVMSQTAFNCLHDMQRSQITKYCNIISVDIPMIEKLGGGSARCMLAEVFLPRI